MPTANCSLWGSLLPLKVRTHSCLSNGLLIFVRRCSVKLALNLLDSVLLSQDIVVLLSSAFCVLMKAVSLLIFCIFIFF